MKSQGKIRSRRVLTATETRSAGGGQRKAAAKRTREEGEADRARKKRGRERGSEKAASRGQRGAGWRTDTLSGGRRVLNLGHKDAL